MWTECTACSRPSFSSNRTPTRTRRTPISANDDNGQLVEYLAYFLIGSLNSTLSVLEVGDEPIMLGSWVGGQWVLSDRNINKNPDQLQFMLSFSKSLIIASKGKQPIVPSLAIPSKALGAREGGDQSYAMKDAKGRPLSVNQWEYRDDKGKMQRCFKGVPSTTICKPVTEAAVSLAGLVDKDGNKVMTSYMPVNGQADESRRIQGIHIDNSGRVKNAPSGKNPSQQDKAEKVARGATQRKEQ